MAIIKVVVAGACGKMGQEVIRAIGREGDTELIGAVDIRGAGEDIGGITGGGPSGIIVSDDLAAVLRETKADVLVDFTHPLAVAGNIRTALASRTAAVVGTTGLPLAEREELHRLALAQSVGVIIAPNFAIGAVLLLQFAGQAARFFPAAEVIERHHPAKADAPSGTALQIAERINSGREADAPGEGVVGKESVGGVRGGDIGGTRIHSVRLPGSVAHHEILFGGLGQTLTLKHDSLSRESFLPGIMLAIRHVKRVKGVVFGLETLLQ